MKACLSLFLLLAFSQLPAQSWFQVGAEWNYGMVVWDGNGPYEFHDRMTVLADTLVGGQQAKRMDYTANWLDVYLSEFVYEDSGRVYAWRDSFWTQLYDFNLGVGDRWIYHVPFPDVVTGMDTVSFKVDSTSTGMYNGVPLKEMWVSRGSLQQGFNFSSGKLVERMGSEGFFFPVEMALIGLPYGDLRCYEDSTVGLWNLMVAPACDYVGSTVGLEEPGGQQMGLEVHPNPAEDWVRIQFPQAGSWEVDVFDMQGRRVKQWRLEGGSEMREEVRGIPKGGYVLQARGVDGQLAVGRLLLR